MADLSKLSDLAGTWGRPPDLPAKIALGVAILLAIAAALGRGGSLLGVATGTPTSGVPSSGTEGGDDLLINRRRFLFVIGLVSAMLSVGYIAIYLRGGPRIIDATTYFLQGRALSHGDLAWPVDDPSASFRGRFLVYREGAPGQPGTMGGIFPPGYPLLLAFGFGIGAPMIVGPLLAAALVVTTYFLARAFAEELLETSLVEPVARAAALLSVASAALRYHTADTMSHGATALGMSLALVFALRARTLPRLSRERTLVTVLAGLAVGGVFATRPVSGIVIALVTFALVARSGARAVVAWLLATVPGVFLLLLSQRAVTGSWLVSTQRLYYALSDGPEDCFRYGFGKNVGCVYEHGAFVRARLGNGFGFVEALGTTLRRLRLHLTDIANFEPLALLVLVPVLSSRKVRRERAGRKGDTSAVAGVSGVTAATALVGLQFLAYAPFYFDGNYPGGGARFFADVLPVEHALVVVAVALLTRHRADVVRAFVRGAMALGSLALVGFAIHASYEHIKLAEREGGKPIFEPDALARAKITSGLVFMNTDHAFALAHDPRATTKDGIVVARIRWDDRDRMLFDQLDHPPTYLYTWDSGAVGPHGEPSVGNATVVPWAPAELGQTLRFEAEADWPPLAQAGGFAAPMWSESCTSGNRVLVLTPTTSGPARATISIPVPSEGRWSVTLTVVRGQRIPDADPAWPHDARATGKARIEGSDQEWSWLDAGKGCAELETHVVSLSPPSARLTFEASGGPVTLDKISLRKLP